jgi:hypothetical protein
LEFAEIVQDAVEQDFIGKPEAIPGQIAELAQYG